MSSGTPGEGRPADPQGVEERCAFCRIVAGVEDARVVYESDAAVAFLDSRPLFVGHTLVVPRHHAEVISDLAGEELLGVMTVVQLLSRAMESALGAEGSFVAVNNRVSQSVPHVHVHVVPRSRGDGLRGFFWPRTRYETDAEAERTAAALRDALADGSG